MVAPLRPTGGLFGPSFVVRGRLTGHGDLAVDGRFEGDIAVAGDITVGAEGSITAGCEVASLVVEGHVRGNVVATSAVTVRAGGRIDGDVRAPRVAIEDGATLHGGIEMDFEIPGALDEGT